MRSFKQILLENTREYGYRLKFAMPITDEQVDCLSNLLSKYELLDMAKPRKTILQKNPLDFPNIPHAEVSIVDVILGRPVSYYVLHQEIKNVLNCPENFVVVRSENEPTELETQRIDAHNEAEVEAKDKDLARQPMLGTESVYPEHEHTPDGKNFYGNEYNQKFKEFLAKERAERRSIVAPVPMPLTDPHANPQSEMAKKGHPKQPDGDFNENIKDAPKTVVAGKDDMPDARKKSRHGNYDDDAKEFQFGYRKPGQEKKIIIRKSSAALRKGK